MYLGSGCEFHQTARRFLSCDIARDALLRPSVTLPLARTVFLPSDAARKSAIKLLATVFEGKDPAETSAGSGGYLSVSEAVSKFLSEYIQLKRKPGTASSYRYALNRYVLPALGKRALVEVTREEVNKLHSSLSAVPYMANRVLTILSSLYSWSERQALVPERCNPARRVEKYRESRREVFLTSIELSRIGEALRVAETTGLPWSVDKRGSSKHLPKADQQFSLLDPFAVASLRLLLIYRLSGARNSHPAMGLRRLSTQSIVSAPLENRSKNSPLGRASFASAVVTAAHLAICHSRPGPT